MKSMSQPQKHHAIERLSSRILYVLVGLVAVVFVLFWLIGYDQPFDENPNFDAPLFTDAVLLLGYLLILGTIGCAVWSTARTLRIRGKGESYDNNIPVKRIGYIIVAVVFVLMLLTLLFGSDAAMNINGATFSDRFWLKAADMFICTSLILLVAAIGTAIFGATRYNRRS
jgi:hypothetical protein